MSDLQPTLEALAAFPAQLERLFTCFSREQWNWAPPAWEGIPSERLTALEQVCHVLDIELDGYRVRFERTLSEHAPVLPDLPGEQLAVERGYATFDPTHVLQRFAAARAETVNTIARFSPQQLHRIAIFEGTQTTLAGLVHFLCSHDHQHLAGLQWLLAKLAR